MCFSKKASLELSIQAVVIVVLAMTLLGLGIFFIRYTFGDLSGTVTDVSEHVQEQVTDDLIQHDKRLSFPRDEIMTGLGESGVLALGVRNKLNRNLEYGMRIETITIPDDAIGTEFEDVSNWFQYGNNRVYSLRPGESEVRNLRLSVPPDAPVGSFFLSIIFFDDEECPSGIGKGFSCIYASKDFFVVVRN